MSEYAVFVRGENYLLASDGEPPRKRDFLVWRCVQAETETQAEQLALQSVRDHEELTALVRNAPDDAPILQVEETRRGFGNLQAPGSGFIFMDVEDRDEPPRTCWGTVTSWFGRTFLSRH